MKAAALLALFVASPLDDVLVALFFWKSKFLPLAILGALIAICFHLVRMKKRIE